MHKIKIVLFIFVALLLVNTSVISATDVGEDLSEIECEGYETALINNGEDVTGLTCDEMKVMYLYPTVSNEDSLSKSIASGFISKDEETAQKEKNMYYYKYLYESHLVPYAGEVDDKFFSADLLSNTGVFIITLFSNLFGLINLLITIIMMFLTSIWSNDTLVGLSNSVISYINEDILGLNSEMGTGILLAGIIGVILLIRLLFMYMKKGMHPIAIVKPTIVTMILIALVPMSYTTLRPILVDTADTATNFVYSKLYGSEDYELDIKEDIFDSIAFNGFMLKNFGVIDEEDLAAKDDLTIDKVNERVVGVLNANEQTLQNEYDLYNNTYLAVTLSSALAQLFLSFLWTINAILSGIILSIPLIFLITIDIIANISFGFVWIVLIKMLFKMEDNTASTFIYNRLQFFLAYVVINFLLIIILKSTLNLLDVVAGLNIGLLLIFDIIFILMYFFIWSIKDSIISMALKFVQSVPSIITGETSVSNIANDLKVSAQEVKEASLEKLQVKQMSVKEEDDNSKVDQVNNYEDDITNTSEIIENEVVNEQNQEVENEYKTEEKTPHETEKEPIIEDIEEEEIDESIFDEFEMEEYEEPV